MKKPRPISGFPEWSPAQTLAEQTLIREAVKVYESYGYTPLDTPVVERVEILTAKGVVDKEIYGLERLRAESRSEGPPELGLRFDLTVPLARYVAQHYGDLSFPFKRYQVGKVWRGERPQEGRFREFYQADIDVIAEESLPLHFDAEMPRVILEILEKWGLRARVRINNRKLLIALYRSLGIDDEKLPDVLREADKLDKIGAPALAKSLTELGLDEATSSACLTLAQTAGDYSHISAQISQLGLDSEEIREGLAEAEAVASALADIDSTHWCLDLGIVRGLDYYTGTIYEANLIDFPELGAVCAGGRYEDLATGFIKRRLPGVGISLGVSRLVSHLFKSGSLSTDRHCPTQVLVILPKEESRATCSAIASQVRAAGLACEVFHLPQAMKKQLRYADRKGIPNVLFPHKYKDGSTVVEVKNLATGEQLELPLQEWLDGRPEKGL